MGTALYQRDTKCLGTTISNVQYCAMKLSLIPLIHDYQTTCRSLSYRELDGLESKEDKIYPELEEFLMEGGWRGVEKRVQSKLSLRPLS